MQTHAEREPSPRSQTQGPSAGAVQFADRRPETAAQTRLEALAQSTHQSAQLRAIQAKADASRIDMHQAPTVQREVMDDEKPLQGKFEVTQRAATDDELPES